MWPCLDVPLEQDDGAGPQNAGRAHRLTARVHGVLGHADAVSYRARRYVEIAEAGGVEDWDLAAA